MEPSSFIESLCWTATSDMDMAEHDFFSVPAQELDRNLVN
jgi:hypothetical protein